MDTKIISVLSSRNKILKNSILSRKYFADILELRLDLMYPKLSYRDIQSIIDSIKVIKNKVNLPIIGTIRLKNEGGKYSGDEQDRLRIYKEIITYLDYIDIEIKSIISRKMIELARVKKIKIILSYHNFSKTPGFNNLFKIVRNMLNLKADYLKIATFISKPDDFLKLTSILKLNSNKIAIIPMTKIKKLAFLRVISILLNSSLFYASLDKSVAPGQLDLIQFQYLLKNK